jgi:hypothetical protein
MGLTRPMLAFGVLLGHMNHQILTPRPVSRVDVTGCNHPKPTLPEA